MSGRFISWLLRSLKATLNIKLPNDPFVFQFSATSLTDKTTTLMADVKNPLFYLRFVTAVGSFYFKHSK